MTQKVNKKLSLKPDFVPVWMRVQLFSRVSLDIAFLSLDSFVSHFSGQISIAFKAFTEKLILGSEKKASQRVKSVGKGERLDKLEGFNSNWKSFSYAKDV